MSNLSIAATAPSVPLITATDELELARTYREHYGSLLAQAQEALRSDLEHYSGKIAQRAMLGVWPGRAKFTTFHAFDAALHEAVRGEAAVQRQKHAALHQRGGNRVPHVVPLSSDEVA